MAEIVIKSNRCKACYFCIEFCPRKLIRVSDSLNVRGVHPAEFRPTDDKECTGCQSCALMCPDVAIEVYK